MKAGLLGIGTAVPASQINQEESVAAARALCSEDVEHADMLTTLYRQSGIEARHVVYRPDEVERIVYGRGECDSPFIPKGLGDRGPTTDVRMKRYELEAPPLAIKASASALETSGVAAKRITHLVTVSCTGLAAPGVDIRLIKDLGLSPDVERTNVGFMGCHGSLNGLRVARGLVAADPTAKVLLCSVELCSLHNYYGWNPKKMVGNALFADGAAAVVIGSDPSPDVWQVRANGAGLFPDSEGAMDWHIRDYGFDMTLSAKVPNLIATHLRPWLNRWIEKHGLTAIDVASWAVHPGGPRVLNGVEETLGLSGEATAVSRQILNRFGNMSSATVLFILRDLIRADAPRPCVALGFGPGLAVEAALFV